MEPGGKPQYFELKYRTCCICSKTERREDMKMVPKSEKILKQWMEFLDQTFVSNVERSRSAMVCKSHFICTHDGKVVAGTLPRTDGYHHFMEEPKIQGPIPKIIIDKLCQDHVYSLHSYSCVSQEINSGQYVIDSGETPDLENHEIEEEDVLQYLFNCKSEISEEESNIDQNPNPVAENDKIKEEIDKIKEEIKEEVED